MFEYIKVYMVVIIGVLFLGGCATKYKINPRKQYSSFNPSQIGLHCADKDKEFSTYNYSLGMSKWKNGDTIFYELCRNIYGSDEDGIATDGDHSSFWHYNDKVTYPSSWKNREDDLIFVDDVNKHVSYMLDLNTYPNIAIIYSDSKIYVFRNNKKNSNATLKWIDKQGQFIPKILKEKIHKVCLSEDKQNIIEKLFKSGNYNKYIYNFYNPVFSCHVYAIEKKFFEAKDDLKKIEQLHLEYPNIGTLIYIKALISENKIRRAKKEIHDFPNKIKKETKEIRDLQLNLLASYIIKQKSRKTRIALLNEFFKIYPKFRIKSPIILTRIKLIYINDLISDNQIKQAKQELDRYLKDTKYECDVFLEGRDQLDTNDLKFSFYKFFRDEMDNYLNKFALTYEEWEACKKSNQNYSINKLIDSVLLASNISNKEKFYLLEKIPNKAEIKKRLEKIDYDKAIRINTIESLTNFIKKYPHSSYVNDINERIAKVKLDQATKKANKIIKSFIYTKSQWSSISLKLY